MKNYLLTVTAISIILASSGAFAEYTCSGNYVLMNLNGCYDPYGGATMPERFAEGAVMQPVPEISGYSGYFNPAEGGYASTPYTNTSCPAGYAVSWINARVYSDCTDDPCASKSGQVGYDLKQYGSPDQAPVAGMYCFDGCQQSAEILWSDCLGGSCVASIKYVYTGQPCADETSVDGLVSDPPTRCTDELNAKIAQCGGSLKVQSFDFETCTGVCTPDSCGDKWNELVDRCGGIMAVSTWDDATCSGTCVNDPVPDIEDPDSEAVPDDVNTQTKTNPDGSTEVTQNKIYNVDGRTYTNSTTTTYDPSGNETGKTTSTYSGSPGGGGSGGNGVSTSESFSSIVSSGDSSSFAQPYIPGEFDIPTRFTTFLNNVKSSGLFSLSSDFFESLPGGGTSTYTVDAGIYGSHTIDLSDTMSGGLAVLKTILLACFGFLSIRAVIMKR